MSQILAGVAHTTDSKVLCDLPQVQFTVITSLGKTITKTVKLRDDGSIDGKSDLNLYDGTGKRHTVTSAQSFADLLPTLTSNQALMLGVFNDPSDSVRIYTEKKYARLSDKTGKAARTNECTQYPSAPAILTIDYDPQDGTPPITPDALAAAIGQHVPLGQTAHVIAHSASSWLFEGDVQRVGQKGLRLYLFVQDGSDIVRAGKALFDRLWLAGHGYHAIAADGSLLKRTLADAMMWQSSRLDYAAGAACTAPLNQQRPKPQAHEGALLDTRKALPDLSDAERAQLAVMIAADKARLKPQADAVRGVYAHDVAKQQLTSNGVTEPTTAQIETVAKQVSKSLKGTVLPSDWLITLHNGGQVTIADLYADPTKYHKQTCKDPIEPTYRNGATTGIIYTDAPDGVIRIVSQAHGLKTHTTCNQSTLEQPQQYSNQEIWDARSAYSAAVARYEEADCDYLKTDKTDPQPTLALTDLEVIGAAFLLVLDCTKVVPYQFSTIEAALDALPTVDALADAYIELCERKRINIDDTMHARMVDMGSVMLDRQKAIVANWFNKRRLKHVSGFSLTDKTRNDKQIQIIPTDNFDGLLTPSAGITVSNAAMGSGKTRICGKAWRDHAAAAGLKFLALTHRTSLAAEMASVLQSTSYADMRGMVKNGGDLAALTQSSVVCINSIDRDDITDHISDATVLMIDEVGQLRKAWAGIYDKLVSVSSTPYDTYDKFCAVFKQAHSVLVLDAAVCDDDIAWLKQMRGGSQPIRIFDHKQKSGDGLKVKFYYSMNGGAQMGVLQQIVELLKAGKKIWVSVGERTTGVDLLNMLELAKLDVPYIFVHSEMDDREKKRVLADVDKVSLEVQLFIATSVISSGVSVTHSDGAHFDECFVVGNGRGAGVDDLVQMARRVRYLKTIRVATWAGNSDSATTSDDRLLYNAGMPNKPDRQTRAKSDPFYKLHAQILARRNSDSADFPLCLALAFDTAGFEMTYIKTGGNMKKKGVLNKMRLQADTDRFNAAAFLNPITYESAKLNTKKTSADHDAINAFEIRDQLGIDYRDPITFDDVELWARGATREPLAKLAGLYGVDATYHESAAAYAWLYGVIFKGVDLDKVITPSGIILHPDVCRRICDNAKSVAVEGVAYDVLPLNYERADFSSKHPVKTAAVIFSKLGLLRQFDSLCRINVYDCLNKRVKQNVYAHPKVLVRVGRLKDKMLDLACIGQYETTPARDRVMQRIETKIEPMPAPYVDFDNLLGRMKPTAQVQAMPMPAPAMQQPPAIQQPPQKRTRTYADARKQFSQFAGVSDRDLVAGIADMLRIEAEDNYSLLDKTYSIGDHVIILEDAGECTIRYRITSAIGSHSPEDVFTILDSLPSMPLDLSRDSTKPANTDLPDAI